MKPFILAVLISSSTISASSQDYQQLRDSAARMREQKKDSTAFRLLTFGIKRANGHPYHNDLYDAAALASLTHQKDTAFYYLNQLLAEGELEMVSCSAQGDPDFQNLKSDRRWGSLMGTAYRLKNEENLRKMGAIADCIRRQDLLRSYSDSALNHLLFQNPGSRELYKRLRHFTQFPTVENTSRQLRAFGVQINDSTYSFYEVQLPDHYEPTKAYPLLLVLHGAVQMNTGFPDPLTTKKYGFMDTTGMNRYFSELGYLNQIIVVYPHGNRDFNWMYPDDGFEMIPNIVKDCKHYFNVDDDRVFVSGHSNGATGVISYLLKEPSFFAGFYGFNSNPRIRTGGTFLKNARNRSYFNVATDKDYYFPLSGHDTLARIAGVLGIDWQNHSYTGYPHWFPQFEASKIAFELMFSDMKTRKRNSFQKDLFWQCDDVAHGSCDWLTIEELDTSSTIANWALPVNFTATHWVDNRDTAKVLDTLVTVFQFPRKSGAIQAHFTNNHFEIKSSGVKKITVLISPEMVDLSRPVTISINGKLRLTKYMKYNKVYMMASFKKNFDRRAIWVDYVTLEL